MADGLGASVVLGRGGGGGRRFGTALVGKQYRGEMKNGEAQDVKGARFSMALSKCPNQTNQFRPIPTTPNTPPHPTLPSYIHTLSPTPLHLTAPAKSTSPSSAHHVSIHQLWTRHQILQHTLSLSLPFRGGSGGLGLGGARRKLHLGLNSGDQLCSLVAG